MKSANSDHIYIGKGRVGSGTGTVQSSNIRVLNLDPYQNPELMRKMTDRVGQIRDSQSGTLKSQSSYRTARRSKPCSQV